MLNQKYDLSPKSNKKRLEMLNQKYKNETYNYSFNDLVKQSEERTINIINKLHECIYKTKDIESLKDVILELDYATGYDTKDDRVMKYFEY